MDVIYWRTDFYLRKHHLPNAKLTTIKTNRSELCSVASDRTSFCEMESPVVITAINKHFSRKLTEVSWRTGQRPAFGRVLQQGGGRGLALPSPHASALWKLTASLPTAVSETAPLPGLAFFSPALVLPSCSFFSGSFPASLCAVPFEPGAPSFSPHPHLPFLFYRLPLGDPLFSTITIYS